MKIQKLSMGKKITKYSKKKIKLVDNTTNKIKNKTKNKIKNKTQKLNPRNKQYVGSGLKIDWSFPGKKEFKVFSTNDTLEKSYEKFNVKINDKVLLVNETYLKDFTQQIIENKRKINFIPYRSFTTTYYHLEALGWYELDIFPYHVAKIPKFCPQEELFHSLTSNQYGTLEKYFSFFYSPPLIPENIQKIKTIQRNMLFAITYRQLEAIKISVKDSDLSKTQQNTFWKYFISHITQYDKLKILTENLFSELFSIANINLPYNCSKKKMSWKSVLMETYEVLRKKFSLRDIAEIIKNNKENADPNKLLSISDKPLSSLKQSLSQHLFSFNDSEINSLSKLEELMEINSDQKSMKINEHQKLMEIIISIRYLFILFDMLSSTDLKKKTNSINSLVILIILIIYIDFGYI